MVRYLKFDSGDPAKCIEAGLDFAALSEIFLGPQNIGTPACMAAPGWASTFIAREYRAAEFTFRALDEPEIRAPNPANGEMVRCTYGFVDFMPDGIPALVAMSIAAPVFGLAFAGLAGRVTHVYLPWLDCVVYDLDRGRAPAVYALFQKYHEMLVMTPVFKRARDARAGVVGLVRNHAHDVMNSLSGLQRLVDSGKAGALDEIWLSGTGFFGPAGDLFPELANKLRLAGPRELPTKINSAGAIFSIGSNIVTAGLRARILRYARRKYSVEPAGAGRWPLVAFTIRAGERRCVNLPEIAERICAALQVDYPDLGIILDGWVTPETDARPAPQAEIDLSKLVMSRLPPGLVVANLVGMPILKSIALLRNIDAYVAHIGTLQHKLAWFTLAKGIVHGPRALLAGHDSGAYSSELGFAPQFTREQEIRDIPSAHPRGAAAYDFQITDASGIIGTIRDILSNARHGEDNRRRICVEQGA